MKASALIVAALMMAGCGPTTPSASAEKLAEVVKVLDGETIQVRTDAHTWRVRLLGIDAPELSHNDAADDCGAAAARRELRNLVDGKTVELVTDPAADRTDRYGRQLAYVQIANVDVGAVLLRGGLVEAWVPASATRPARFARYQAIQEQARRSGTGSWAKCGRLGR